MGKMMCVAPSSSSSFLSYFQSPAAADLPPFFRKAVEGDTPPRSYILSSSSRSLKVFSPLGGRDMCGGGSNGRTFEGEVTWQTAACPFFSRFGCVPTILYRQLCVRPFWTPSRDFR